MSHLRDRRGAGFYERKVLELYRPRAREPFFPDNLVSLLVGAFMVGLASGAIGGAAWVLSQ